MAITLGEQLDAAFWPRLKLEENDEVTGVLVGFAGPFIAIDSHDVGGVVLNPHKDLITHLRRIELGSVVTIRMTNGNSTPFQYEVT